MADLDIQYIGYRLLKRGFDIWFRYMFKAIEQTDFIMEPIHYGLIDYFNKIYNGEVTRLNVNLPPRAGKTTLAKFLLVYALTINPKSNIIYTSYSQSLLTDIALSVRDILEHPVYKAMYNNGIAYQEEELNPVDDFWAEYLKKETGKNTYSSKKIITSKGGVCLFASIGSQITGYGCFSYDTLVYTEDGYKKIGDIVENKYNGKIWSYNFATKQKELQPIYDYVKNEKSDYLKLILDNGEIINCTPDHIFYLKNGQEIRANKLRIGFKIMSNSLDLGNRHIQFFSNFFSRVVFIKSKFNLFFGKIFKIIIKFCSLFIPLITYILGNFSPNTSAFNITNRTIRQIIIFSYLLIWAFIFCNCNGNFFSDFVKFTVGIVLIFHIFFTCSIAKIFKSIIRRVRIKMSDLIARFTNKGKQNKPMYKQSPISTVFAKINSFISFIVGVLFHKMIAFCGKNITCFGNIISLIFGYREIVDIVDCKHTAPSYCVTLWNNNNFYITKSQVLVHNCGTRSGKGFTGALIIDDANKPDDIYHSTLRNKVIRYFSGTLLSRLNNSNVPIINIQQRLHIEDLSGILQTKYGFETLKKPLIDENGNCQIPNQYTEERIKELKIDNYVFSSQYQQEPIILGGQVIKREWFGYYKENETYNYKQIVIAADTAISSKEFADYSCFLVGGVTNNNRLHILEMVHGKWEYPELKQQAIEVYNRWQLDKRQTSASSIVIENRASGQQLIQDFKKAGLPVKPIEVTKDKLSRVQEVLDYIANGNVLLPENEQYSNNPELLAECEAFTRDLTQPHDDIVDTLVHLINNTIAKRQVSILEVL